MNKSPFKIILLLFSILFLTNCDDDTVEDTDATETETETEDTSDGIINDDYTVGLLLSTDDAYDGYTLFYPLSSSTTYLINNCGELVQTWSSDYTSQAAYLLENGNLLHTVFVTPVNSEFDEGGGETGRVEMIDSDDELVWYYEVNTSTTFMHHDAEYIDATGNILVMVWEKHTAAEAIAAGYSGNKALWSERILEIDPDLAAGSGGTIVWEWDAWDHLIQDENEDEENFGIVEDNPQLLNLNYDTSADQEYKADWLHCNAVDYNADLDQIILSCRLFSEFWILDHSTTTEEAASHSGGTYGKGGDILYRWGNPQTYDRGDENDRMLYLQHDANWIDDDYEDGGQVMVFNNQAGYYATSNYSTVNVINTNVNTDGSYSIQSDSTYLPTDFTWTYMANTPSDLYSSMISGARRLPNGNTMICEGMSGTFYEVTYDGEIVWEYINPVDATGILDQYDTPSSNLTFRCNRYGTDYAGLDYYDLTSQGTIESGSDYDCSDCD
ncbi:aryl-sulfate sulfotransferase [Labilibaculum sp.]|uniref:aryl-sulfate sulfotransferase n=1 Tax=Labilibaculum sp. TaxID=2060723 RepID=UPI00356812C0